MTTPDDGPLRAARHLRPNVAKWLVSLRVRLPLLVALVVSVVIGAAGYWEIGVFEDGLTADLAEIASSTGQAVADDLEISPDPSKRADLEEMLHEFTDAFPTIRAILVMTVENDQPTVVASTSSAEGKDWLVLAREAMRRERIVTAEPVSQIHLIGVPVKRDGRVWGAVVVTYSLASVAQLRSQGRTVVLWFVPAAVVLVTLVLDLLMRRLVHRPVAAIRNTMRRVRARDLGARAPVLRNDEIGAVAQGLNEMLAEMEGFNVALQDRVREATAELRAKNEELVESYRARVRAARGAGPRRATGGRGPHGRQRGPPGRDAAEPHLRLRADDPGRGRGRFVGHAQAGDRAGADCQGHLDRADDDGPRQAAGAEAADRRGRAAAARVGGCAPEARRAGRQAGPARRGRAARDGRRGPARTGAPQPGHEQSRRHALGRRHVDDGGADAPDGNVRIEVADTGTGIAPDLLPRIFDPWVTTKESGRGTGLGLSITREVVVGHGGTITAKSEVGVGSVFTIELPPRPRPMRAPAHGDRRTSSRARKTETRNGERGTEVGERRIRTCHAF